MIVKSNLLYLNNDKQVDFVDTPNKSGTINPLYLMVHYTAGTSFDSAVSWLSQKASKASAHFVIGRDGELVQMVALNRKAWHAGRSQWGELVYLNNYSIGIELVNAGKLHRRGDGKWVNWANHVIPDKEVALLTHPHETKEAGWHIYPETQLQKAIEVAAALNEKYEFRDILGHEDVAKGRKVDPSPAFPMISFSSQVLGREE